MKNQSEFTDKLLDKAVEVKEEIRTTIPGKRDLFLSFLSEAISSSAKRICEANDEDLAVMQKKGATEEEIEAHRLDFVSVGALAGHIMALKKSMNPCDETYEWETENGIAVKETYVPLGIVLGIYSFGAAVLFEHAAMCIKTGNVFIAIRPNITPKTDAVLKGLMDNAFACSGMNRNAVIITGYDPKYTERVILRNDSVDALILRASEGIESYVRANTNIPVIESEKGYMSVYIDEKADVKKASEGIALAYGSKNQARLRCVYVNWMISDAFLAEFEEKSLTRGIEIAGDERIKATLRGIEEIDPEDLDREKGNRLCLITVNNIDDAISRISENTYGICETIYSGVEQNIKRFTESIDAGTIMVNESPAHLNGVDLGFGGDIGVSTDKQLQRGAVGIRKLVTVKYIVTEKSKNERDNSL